MGRFSNLEASGSTAKPNAVEAVPLDSSAQRLQPRDERSCMRDADHAWRSGRAERALQLYSRALEFDPNLAAAWVGQAWMLLELGELAEANLWSTKGLELFRDHPDLLAVRAVAQFRLGHTVEAQAWSDAAIGAKQAGIFPWLARAEVLLGVGQSGGEHCLRKAVSMGADAWIRVLAARVCLIHGHHAAALEWARQAASSDARMAMAWLAVAQAAEKMGLISEANSAIKQVRLIDPDLPSLPMIENRLNNRSVFSRVRDAFRGFFQ